MDHPLPDLPNAASRTEPANHEPVKSALPAQEIFEGLSLLLTIEEILQLHRDLRHRSEAEVRSLAEQCHRSSAALSNSQRSSRSSLITRFSRMSLASCTSTASHELTVSEPQSSSASGGHISVAHRSDDPSPEYSPPTPNPKEVGNESSYSLLGLTSPPAVQEASYKVAEGPTAVNKASARPNLGVTFPLANPALPHPQARHAPLANNICYACDKSFKSANTLAKHQTEFCERKVKWACRTCPHKVYGLQERLNRHHMEVHAETCPNGCDKREKLLSEACKTQLSKCSRPVTTKKAWGCPCCVKCFESLEEWSHHGWSHPVQNEKVQDWSFSTMMWSLLKQPYFPKDMTRKYWGSCNWSTLPKEASNSLRYALERREVPADVMAHPDYRGIDDPTALAMYAFNLGTTGKAYTRGCKPPRVSEANPDHSLSPSSHTTFGSTDSPQHRRGVEPTVHLPAGWRLPVEEATFVTNVNYKSEASSSFRERVSGQTCNPPRHSRRTLADQSDPQISMPEDAPHLLTIPSNGEPGYHRFRWENQYMVKPTSNNPTYITYPPVTPDDELASSLHSAPQRGDSSRPVRLHYDPNDSESKCLQTKKSQANLHGRFAYNRDPTLHRDEAPDLPTCWQDPHTFSLDTNGHMPTFDHLAPQRPHTASSRPVTPARSEMSQGSWTKLLNTSSSHLPGARYSMAMSLSGPPSDVDMGWV